MPLPASLSYGYVVWKALLAVADTTADPDRLPDPVSPAGEVRFVPLSPSVLATDVATTVIPQTITATLDANGALVDPTLAPGVWLLAGQYDVLFSFTGVTLPAARITVHSGHTLAAPLELAFALPLMPSPAEKWVVNEAVYNETVAAKNVAVAAAATASAVPKWWAGGQAAYTALAVKDPTTFYFITGA